MPRLFASPLLSLLIASSASAVTIDGTPIGNPGNACDPQPPDPQGGGGRFCAVGYSGLDRDLRSSAQYADLLNAKAANADPFGLYNTGRAHPNLVPLSVESTRR